VDANTILYGDVALLDAAMRRLTLPASATPSPLIARAKTLSAGNDFWIGGSLPNIPAVALFGAGIRSLAAGLSLQQDFRFQVSLDMATAELAQALAAEARQSIEEARQQNKIEAKQEIEVTGTTLHMKISMDMDRLSKLVADRLTDVAPMAGPVSGPGPSSTSPNRTQPQLQEAQPQQPKSIKIYGLDDGPKEIPLSRP
jgi:multidrug efflux pump subunit AcrA (membrane-fusion protein)